MNFSAKWPNCMYLKTGWAKKILKLIKEKQTLAYLSKNGQGRFELMHLISTYMFKNDSLLLYRLFNGMYSKEFLTKTLIQISSLTNTVKSCQ